MQEILREEYRNFNEKVGIVERRYVSRFVNMIVRARSLEDRLQVMQILHRTESAEILEEVGNSRGLRIIVGFLKIYKKYVLQNDRESEGLFGEVVEWLGRLRPEGQVVETCWDILEEVMVDYRRYPEGIQRALNHLNIQWKRALDYHKAKHNPPRSRSRSREHRDNRKKKTPTLNNTTAIKQQKKQVRFNDQKLKSVKYYMLSDEASAKEVSEEDYVKMLHTRGRGGGIQNFASLKHQESKMEGKSKNMQMQQEQQKTAQMNKLSSEIEYQKLKKVDIGGGQVGREGGQDSKEKQAHGHRIASKLSCFYISENMVPDTPCLDNLLASGQEGWTTKHMPREEQEEDNQECNKEFEQLLQAMDRQSDYVIVNTAIIHRQPSKGILKQPPLSPSHEIDPQLLQRLIKVIKQKDTLDLQAKNHELQDIINIIKAKYSGSQVIQNIQKVKQVLQILSQKQSQDQTFNSQRMQHMKGKFRGDYYNQQSNNLQNQPQKINNINNSSFNANNLYNTNNNKFSNSKFGVNSTENGQQNNNTSNNNNNNNNSNNTNKSQFNQQNNQNQIMNSSKYKTVPCRLYHSEKGCNRGEMCHFIHEKAFEGKEIPRGQLNNYAQNINNNNNNGINMKQFPNRNLGNGMQKPPGMRNMNGNSQPMITMNQINLHQNFSQQSFTNIQNINYLGFPQLINQNSLIPQQPMHLPTPPTKDQQLTQESQQQQGMIPLKPVQPPIQPQNQQQPEKNSI